MCPEMCTLVDAMAALLQLDFILVSRGHVIQSTVGSGDFSVQLNRYISCFAGHSWLSPSSLLCTSSAPSVLSSPSCCAALGSVPNLQPFSRYSHLHPSGHLRQFVALEGTHISAAPTTGAGWFHVNLKQTTVIRGEGTSLR